MPTDRTAELLQGNPECVGTGCDLGKRGRAMSLSQRTFFVPSAPAGSQGCASKMQTNKKKIWSFTHTDKDNYLEKNLNIWIVLISECDIWRHVWTFGKGDQGMGPMSTWRFPFLLFSSWTCSSSASGVPLVANNPRAPPQCFSCLNFLLSPCLSLLYTLLIVQLTVHQPSKPMSPLRGRRTISKHLFYS